MSTGKKVTLVEVGLRDGLQNEKTLIDAEAKIELGRQLLEAGVRRLEAGSFVSAKWIPQMADSAKVIEGLNACIKEQGFKGVVLSALVPNERGMLDALETKVPEIAVFAACSESFSQKNLNCSIEESFERFVPVIKLAKKNKIKVRGYLSTCFGCPFEGPVPEAKVVELATRLIKMGVFEVSIGDTIGIAHPAQIESLFRKLKKRIPVKKLAGHFHDTRGQALANILTAWRLGVQVFDTSLGGLGGCPYAPGASGNVATEDVVYMFEGMGIRTGLNLEKLFEINPWVAHKIGHSLPSRVGKAGPFRPKPI